MTRRLGSGVAVAAMLCMLFVLEGCSKENENAANAKSTVAQGPGQGKGGGPGGGKKGRSPIHDIMVKLAKGPESLNSVIGDELKADAPPWDKLQPQTKEFADLATSLVKLDPPRGSKESWTKLTGTFTDSAVALDQSVQGKDKDMALAAHKLVSDSCMACHQQHKGGPGGKGPGGFGGKGGPGGPGGKGPGGPPKGPDQ
ncbi:MAG TPA: hypothetical protein VNX28_12985 [Gemmataceae bacterium]|jgi:hypothetical protein|nr:hypothetical protein [Gemmataceae bacterium]